VFGSVEDQAHGGRGESLAPDLPALKEAVGWYHPQVVDRRLQSRCESGQQVGQLVLILVDCALAPQNRHLVRRETIATGVRQESIEAARQMRQVEANRRSASGARPKLIRREVLHDGKHILADLDDGVSRRL
jgi:hypothetical protein